MKKFAILFAMLAAMTAAQAQVTVFGTMDAGFTTGKAPGVKDSSTSFTSGGMTTSNIGLKGTEDLGRGTKAVFEVSSFLNNGNGATLGGTTANMWTRSAFVGLGNDRLGTVTLGRQSNPSFLPTILFNAYGDSGAYGPLWHATYFGNTGNPATRVFNDTAWDNAAVYTSPKMGGATFSVAGSKNAAGNNTGANVLWFQGPVGLTAYWQETRVNSSGSFQTDIFTGNGNKPAVAKGVGASYDAKVAKLFATYQETDSDSLKMKGKTTQVSARVPVGAGNILAEVATSKFNNAGVKKDFNEWALGYDHNLSKRTDVYATVGRTSVTGVGVGETFGVGLRHRF